MGLSPRGHFWHFTRWDTLSCQPPRGNSIALLPPPTSIPIQVHISGEGQNPGVYALPPGSRVQDAVTIADGYSAEANTTSLNLAVPLEDGIRLQVPAQTPVKTPALTLASSSKDEKTSTQQSLSPTMTEFSLTSRINTASQEELETLSDIGPATAQKNHHFPGTERSFYEYRGNSKSFRNQPGHIRKN